MPSARGTYFGSSADDYDRLRPSPAPAALDWLLPDGPTGVLLDLAAGTGLLTRELTPRAGRVVAVEPDARMLDRLTAAVPAAHPVRGTAEELPLADGTVDGVLAASAWHWFDADRAAAEVARVLRPGGVLGLLWTRPDPSYDWVAGVRRIGQAHDDGSVELARHGFDVTLPAGAPFGRPVGRTVPWRRPMPRGDVATMVTTYSGVLALPEPERAEIRRRAVAYLDEAAPPGPVLDVPFETVCWRAVRT